MVCWPRLLCGACYLWIADIGVLVVDTATCTMWCFPDSVHLRHEPRLLQRYKLGADETADEHVGEM